MNSRQDHKTNNISRLAFIGDKLRKTLINKNRVFLIAFRISSIDIRKKVMRYPAKEWHNVLENIKQKCEKEEKSRLRLACLNCLSQVICEIRKVH